MTIIVIAITLFLLRVLCSRESAKILTVMSVNPHSYPQFYFMGNRGSSGKGHTLNFFSTMVPAAIYFKKQDNEVHIFWNYSSQVGDFLSSNIFFSGYF